MSCVLLDSTIKIFSESYTTSTCRIPWAPKCRRHLASIWCWHMEFICCDTWNYFQSPWRTSFSWFHLTHVTPHPIHVTSDSYNFGRFRWKVNPILRSSGVPKCRSTRHSSIRTCGAHPWRHVASIWPWHVALISSHLGPIISSFFSDTCYSSYVTHQHSWHHMESGHHVTSHHYHSWSFPSRASTIL